MNEHRFTESLLFKALCISLFTAIIIFILIFFKELLKPIALGILLWYLIKAFNALIEKIKIRGKPLNPWIRRAIALLAIVGIVEGSIQILVANINQIIINYPTYLATLNSMIVSLGNDLGLENITASIKNKIGELNIEGFLKDIVTSTSTLVGNLFLIFILFPVFIFKFEHFEYAKVAPLFARLSQEFERCVYGLNIVKNELEVMQHPIARHTNELIM